MRHSPTSILLIDEDADSRSLIRLLIKARWPDVSVYEVANALAFAGAMSDRSYILAIVDPVVGWAGVGEIIAFAVERLDGHPVLVYCEHDSAEMAVEAMRNGAHNYIVKNNKGLLKLENSLEEFLQEEEPVQSEQLQTRRQLQMLSHDIQEPVRSVLNYLEVLREEHKGELDPSAVALITSAEKAARQARATISDVLRPTPPTPTGNAPEVTDPSISPVKTSPTTDDASDQKQEVLPELSEEEIALIADANQAFEVTLETLSAAINRSGAQITRDDLLPAGVQPIHLQRIFQNLISNAVKFQDDAPPQIHATSKVVEGLVVFSISDNGIGIPQKDKERIFTMFTRAHDGEKYPGTGIGLATCKKIAASYGGRIWLASSTKQGSTFCVALPMPKADAEELRNSG